MWVISLLAVLSVIGLNNGLPMYEIISTDDDDILKNNYIEYVEDKRNNEIMEMLYPDYKPFNKQVENYVPKRNCNLTNKKNVLHPVKNDVIYPIVLLHGITSDKNELSAVEKWIKNKLPNPVYNLEIGNGKKTSVYKSMEWQLDELCDTIYSMEQLVGGFHFIGMSQGGLLARGYVERCNKYPVINLITWVTPHAGVFGLGNIEINFKLIYSPLYQVSLSFAGYWKDPFRYGLYLNNSSYLADLNNEHKHFNLLIEQRENMLKLKNFVMIWSQEDDIIRPPESGKFGFYKIQTKDMSFKNINMLSVNEMDEMLLPIVDLKDSIQYKEDWLGLKTLDESRRLHILETNCTHSGHKTESCFPQLEVLTFPFL